MEDYYWVPDDVEIWTKGLKNSDLLPNGCVNFLIKKKGVEKSVAFPTDRCYRVRNMQFIQL